MSLSSSFREQFLSIVKHCYITGQNVREGVVIYFLKTISFLPSPSPAPSNANFHYPLLWHFLKHPPSLAPSIQIQEGVNPLLPRQGFFPGWGDFLGGPILYLIWFPSGRGVGFSVPPTPPRADFFLVIHKKVFFSAKFSPMVRIYSVFSKDSPANISYLFYHIL